MQDDVRLAPPLRSIHVIQGTHAVSNDPDTVLSTVLGSCVATCLWDDRAGWGGMNHFLLPEATGSDAEATLFGAYAVELLINELLKHGASKSSLRAKLFGGGRIVDGLSDIGAKNGVSRSASSNARAFPAFPKALVVTAGAGSASGPSPAGPSSCS